MTHHTPKVLIIGAGAIGSFYGAKLAQSGLDVSVIARSDYDIVKNHGITIESCWQEERFFFHPKHVLRRVEDYGDKADFIIVATKALPNIVSANLIKPALHPNTSIVLMQNGIHIEKDIAKTFPNHHLISILAFVCVSKIAAGTIHHQDYGRLVVGDFPKGFTAKTQQLVTAWKRSGVPCQLSPNIQMERWKKLIWNAPFNPISVISGGMNTKEILENKTYRQLVQDIMQEICLLAKEDGCELPDDIADQNMQSTLKMKPYKTSMLLDFEAGRAMEIDVILGNAITFARTKSIPVPHLSKLLASLSRYQ